MPGFTRGRHKVPADERDKQERHSGHEDRAAVSLRAAPVAGLLFAPDARPGIDGLRTLSQRGRAFSLSHEDASGGWAEILCDGLTFDCCGLAPAKAGEVQGGMQLIGLPRDFAASTLAQVTLAPGPHLAGSGNLQPVVRILSGLVMALARMPGVRAVTWLPAQIAMSPEWFVEAVGIWLKGGPFPALALTGLVRADGGIASRGLAYFTGQEFILSGKDGKPGEGDLRVAIRLVDWLVAHGRVDAPREVTLVGFGPVWVEPDSRNSLKARVL